MLLNQGSKTMMMLKTISTSCLLVMTLTISYSQNEAVVLIIPNVDAQIFLDGVEKGKTNAGAALRITAAGGEHYVEARTMAGLTKGEVVQLESGKQKILKLDFDKSVVDPIEIAAVSDLNFGLPGTVTVVSWQSSNEGKKCPYPEYYYAFEKGDELILNLSMSNKNGTNQINISTYPDGIERFSNNAFTELNDLRIKVPERSIYRFAFATNHTFDRNAFLKIGRKPATTETANFNTKVVYTKTLVPVSVLEPQGFFINSGSNAFLGGKSRVLVPVNLPSGTV